MSPAATGTDVTVPLTAEETDSCTVGVSVPLAVTDFSIVVTLAATFVVVESAVAASTTFPTGRAALSAGDPPVNPRAVHYVASGPGRRTGPHREGGARGVVTPMPVPFTVQGKEAIRRVNLSAALASVRQAGQLSRSGLIRSLRLGRTTVFELVGQLVDLGLLVEDERPEVAGVGRPSFVVRPSPQVGAFVVNPESDGVTVGAVTLGGELLASVRRPTPSPLGPGQTVDVAAALLEETRSRLPGGFRIAGTGVAIPGQVDRASGLVHLAPRLGWSDVDFASMLADRLGTPARADNNARLVALAEHRAGIAKGLSDFVYVYAGAGGIGGGVVVNGRIVVGKNGFAGELGHVRITQDARPDFGGISGTLEALVRRDELLALLGGEDLSDEEIDARVDAAPADLLLPLAERQLQVVGAFIGDVANVFDPQLVALGGFVGSLYRRFPEPLLSAMSRVALPAIGGGLDIRATSDARGKVLLGAAELVFQEIVDDPMAFGVAAAHGAG